MQRILIILLFFIAGCGTASKITAPDPIAENNKDVLILSILIKDYLIRTNAREIDINELMQNDTLKRISANFEKIELKNRGGYISVCYTFSKSRNNKIELTNKEKEKLNLKKWIVKQVEGYDGEIQFDFEEKFYHVKKIIVKPE